MVHVVTIDKLADVWPEVHPWIERAISRGQGDENVWDVFVALARGTYVLWHAPTRFAAVVQTVRQPRQSVATILYCGGTGLSEIEEAFAFGKLWARENGIDVMRVWGREGWERLLGMERVGVILQVKV